ncbi:L-ascorbate metabolism protein UlaG, beta-lactamase superfamily [Cognatiyoonia koreensis]|uniref:L-ascorbate metabolism protein UlaG, beta-lactamase superfamily n=1 Tax=Cognatiyoonia koreensis TaxID=364200 RepID=A0A1I0PP64_9RHOB|nr:MBL fold metallo-hydrolase [Cognatiyoonia koreensis]SEW16170.1 L-ascorbate metabolism protein UlaG, beta-lactamase superfamily [Cognatiyoonia koreensis]
MTPTRRQFLVTGTAALTVLPFAARADGHAANVFPTANGEVAIHPISHASFVMETPSGVIYVDPVGDADLYADKPAADFVLITHEHGDHYDEATLGAVVGESTTMITNPAVFDMMSEEMRAKATSLANGENGGLGDVSVDAIPAYNITEDRLNFHPQGRDNGYVLTVDDMRIYISGDTEDIPEMRALENIDLAFVCMNLPFTMDAESAASAVSEFAPTYVYPYHYRGRDNGTQDPQEFADMLADGIEAKMGGWYG